MLQLSRLNLISVNKNQTLMILVFLKLRLTLIFSSPHALSKTNTYTFECRDTGGSKNKFIIIEQNIICASE